MKVKDFYSKSLEENLKEMDLKNVKVNTDDDGNVVCVELKYRPNTTEDSAKGGKVNWH